LDHPTNKDLIQDALERAAKAIREDDSIKVEPVVDRDTAGVAGSPDIAATIFEKIDASQVFVCDVSIINDQEKARPTPNPNVLVELGYALGVLKSERVLMVMNTAFGEPESLPFDLSKKRVITYRLTKEHREKAAVRKELALKVENDLRMIVDNMGDVSVRGELSGDKLKLKGECEAVLVGGNSREWRRLVDQLSRDIPKRLLEWKPKAEGAWQQDSGELDALRLEAVEICLPSFVPILVAVENERADLWEQAVGSLRQLALLRDQMGGGIRAAIEIGGHMLYIAGSLGMAIATETKQLDLVNSWMRLRMPATLYGEDTEKLWAEIKCAHYRWGKYLPCAPDPFKDLWQVCQSGYLSGFFTEKRLLEKHLFLANLVQSLYELGRYTEDSNRLEALKAGDIQSFDPSELKVWPVWTLMKPDDFKSATWDLFGTSAGVIEFVSSEAAISPDDFWVLWRMWKHICGKPMEARAFQRGELPPQSEYLMLPGEPHIWK
jgi:hypothetical protein